MILQFIFLNQLFQVNCFFSHVLRALLVRFQAEGVSTLVHVHRAEAKAQNIELTSLAGALAIALAIDHLFVMVALSHHLQAWFHARAFVVNHTIRAHWCTHVALSNDKARWALREPLLFAFLAILALFLLTIATPERKRLFASFIILLEELRAGIVIFDGLNLLVSKGVPLLFSLSLSATLMLGWLLLELLRLSCCMLTSLAATVTAS